MAVLGQKRKVPKEIIYLGKISYGLYAFHQLFFWIVFSLPLMHRLASHKGLAIPLVLAATIGTSALSYWSFEKPILRLKHRFETVRTRPL